MVLVCLFIFIYEIIMSIISYKILERYSWKECLIAIIILNFGISIISNRANFFRILITSIIESGIMMVVYLYIYNKDYDERDYIFRASFLNIFAFCGYMLTSSLLSSSHGFGEIIKVFGMILLFIVGLNALGYVMQKGEHGNGVLILVDSVIYMIVLLVLMKKQGVVLGNITKSAGAISMLLKLIIFCIVSGSTTAIIDKGAYEETDNIKSYLVISCLKKYAVDATILTGMVMYLMSKVWFSFR